MAQKDVEKLNEELTIQLDNLCQFLPQEKVVEFSKMTPTELLLSTERAIGNGSLADMHEKLISGCKQMRDVQDKQCDSRGCVPLRALCFFRMRPNLVSTEVALWMWTRDCVDDVIVLVPSGLGMYMYVDMATNAVVGLKGTRPVHL